MCLSLRAKVLFTSWLHVVCADLLLCHAILAPSAARDSIHIAQFVDERIPIILIVAAIWAVVSGLLLWGTYGQHYLLHLPWLVFMVFLMPVKLAEVGMQLSKYCVNSTTVAIACGIFALIILYFVYKYAQVLTNYRQLRQSALNLAENNAKSKSNSV